MGDGTDLSGLSTSLKVRSSLGNIRVEFMFYGRYLSSWSDVEILRPFHSYFIVFLKFLKDTRTAVMLSRVL